MGILKLICYGKLIVILNLTDEMYQEFVCHPKMVPIRERTVWVNVEVPGQGHAAPDLPPELVSFVIY